MKTQIKKEGDTWVVSMEGYLDFENQMPFRERLIKLANQTRSDIAPKKIIFNLENLKFVGSSGISAFIQALKEFGENTSTKPRYCHVKSEFQRLMKAFDEKQEFEFFNDEEDARLGYDQ